MSTAVGEDAAVAHNSRAAVVQGCRRGGGTGTAASDDAAVALHRALGSETSPAAQSRELYSRIPAVA